MSITQINVLWDWYLARGATWSFYSKHDLVTIELILPQDYLIFGKIHANIGYREGVRACTIQRPKVAIYGGPNPLVF